MDHLPPEIWEQISSFACIDSGQTGRSLSLVSRYIRDVSRSSQYQSVSLTRSKYILTFRQTLLHAPLEARRIKYLHVCCPNVFLDVSDEEYSDYVETPTTISSPSGSNESMEIGSDSSGEEYEGPLTVEELEEVFDDLAVRQSEHPPLLQGSNDNDDHRYLQFWDDFDENIHNADTVVLEAFRDILDEASSSLLILSVNWTSYRPLLIETLLPPLPNLVELHLRRTFTLNNAIFPRTEDAPPILFPRLRRLHIFGYTDYQQDSFGQSLGRIAPSLTHIRMPNDCLRRLEPFETLHYPDTIQKVVFEFPLREDTGWVMKTLFGPGVHSKEITGAFRSWVGDPSGWERSWMERVMGLDGPW